jgi:hypothetical protein
MSSTPRSLPPSPDLRHLKDQAKDLLRRGGAKSLADAQFQVARSYGFESWPKLKVHVDLLHEAGQLKQAIDLEDLDRVKQLMARRPSLHQAPLGYKGAGPLTWVAECRSTSGPPSVARLELAKWMIENGSDVHQGGDAPLMRAALSGERTAMMELLVAYGADVNAKWNGSFPILFAPCETVDPTAIEWLLAHGADQNIRNSQNETALDYLLQSYVRSSDLARCIDVLASAGSHTRYDVPVVLDVIAGRLDDLAARLANTPQLIEQRWQELHFGATGARRLVLKGGTLLHVAAEFGSVEAARLLIDSGADVNARAALDEHGVGGQTPIFHAVTQFQDRGLSVTRVLLEAGADLSVRATVPGSYETSEDLSDCSPLEYARRFPGEAFPGSNGETQRLLTEWHPPKP